MNVFVGTDGFGSVYPGPQVPFGGIQISPVWFILKAIRSGAILLKGNWYFLGGDNVLNSRDSRYFGLVPQEYIVGVVI